MNYKFLNTKLKKYISENNDITVTNINTISTYGDGIYIIRYNYWTNDLKFKEGVTIINNNEYLRIIRKEKLKELYKQ